MDEVIADGNEIEVVKSFKLPCKPWSCSPLGGKLDVILWRSRVELNLPYICMNERSLATSCPNTVKGRIINVYEVL
jgi:hypothetical protein